MGLGLHRVYPLMLLWAYFSGEHVLLLEVLHRLLHRLLTLELSVATLETLTDMQWRGSQAVIPVLPVCSRLLL